MPEQSFINYQKALDDLKVGYGDQVADFGCGTAAFFTMEAARRVGDKGKVYAIDVVRNILANVATRAKLKGFTNVVTVWSNLEIYGATKIPDQAIDLAILVNVLFQSKKRKELIAEIVRTIKVGGKLFVADWKVEKSPLGPPLEMRVQPNEIQEICKLLGLREVAWEDVSSYHWGLVFVKQ